ncbi:hypothetical protein BT96DRAFT_998945 [Gymnopus androsaceus JB14]|uniref:Uncharacterized protein n=1 Tax=Gymnopus androsaceus JB14 TaxID=1447944 RepID=A0A6A4H6Z3_9AGAR|nr:hypothetical protein BT96DRAFT_998945 [Gymnopus androsaceus JB14]
MKSLAQVEWLKNHLPNFYSHQSCNKLSDFWPKIKRDYLAAFPVEGQDSNDLDPDQTHALAVLVKKHQDSVYYWFNNVSNNQKCHKGNAPSFNMTVDLVSGETITSASSPPDDLEKGKKQKRAHKILELFIMEYYDTF